MLFLQGREKDVTIFSCVRSSGQKHKSIGFVADTRRINVGITRARCALVVVGNANSLSVDDNWRALIKSSVDRDCFYQVTEAGSGVLIAHYRGITPAHA